MKRENGNELGILPKGESRLDIGSVIWRGVKISAVGLKKRLDLDDNYKNAGFRGLIVLIKITEVL